jgi:hypothetical protein
VVTVEVRYVNGTLITTQPEAWVSLRADGIDYVDLTDDGGNASRIQGQSVYWLYREGDAWVAGGGIVGHAEMVEATVPGHEYRRPRYMPDLDHAQVKLGWWLPGDGD